MNSTLYPANERGTANFGWLQANYSFSFGQWYNPNKVHFGALRVLNDDTVHGGGGFPTHPHSNMEIITIPLQGELQHKDSTGGQGVIQQGDVQVMSAGTGVEHSEFNASATDSVNLFQLWIYPNKKDITPSYDQKSYANVSKTNNWLYLVSDQPQHNALTIQQQATIATTLITTSTTMNYTVQHAGNGVYLMVISGSITIANNTLGTKDAIGITEATIINITNSGTQAAELLLVEVPMQW